MPRMVLWRVCVYFSTSRCYPYPSGLLLWMTGTLLLAPRGQCVNPKKYGYQKSQECISGIVKRITLHTRNGAHIQWDIYCTLYIDLFILFQITMLQVTSSRKLPPLKHRIGYNIGMYRHKHLTFLINWSSVYSIQINIKHGILSLWWRHILYQ